ncbi:hypothetical protein MACH09_37210 [Vibrio sp. MACH09]|nr:hypothetical protein MACH09_37210 [Vibrio sp. MACH09]
MSYNIVLLFRIKQDITSIKDEIMENFTDIDGLELLDALEIGFDLTDYQPEVDSSEEGSL